MEKINLWESKMNNKYLFFTDVESYLKYLDENNLDLFFITKDSYNPDKKTENIFDDIALSNNIEIVYTDMEHPIALGTQGFAPTFINPTFFKQNEQIFKEYALKKFKDSIEKKKYRIVIPDFIFSDEILKIITEDDNKDINYSYREYHTGYNLTEEQINKIKENHLEFTINKRFEDRKQISTKYLIGRNSLRSLETIDELFLYLPLSDEEINNFIYINDNAKIILNTHSTDKVDEDNYLNQINYIMKKLSKMNKSFNIMIYVDNREKVRQSNLLNNIPNNVNLIIENDFHKYDIETYTKEEDKLEALVTHIREANLSPFEKYLAVYDIVKNFKPYKENENDKKQSRYLRYILDDDSEYMVCVGYSKLLTELLNRVNIPCNNIHADIDITRSKEYNPETDDDLEGHQRNIIKIDDDIYNIHGYYLADSTWDNDNKLNLYLNAIMTFDRKKEARDLETLQNYDLLLDFHNFEEFQRKINYHLKRNIKNSFATEEDRKIKSAYSALFNNILEQLSILDYQKYSELYDKYHQYFNSSIDLKILEEKASDMLTEYAEYIIPLSNNKISIDTILKAATNVKKELYHFNNKEIKEWLEKATKDNSKYEKKVFPYKYDPDNKTEAYLEDYIEEEENKHTR